MDGSPLHLDGSTQRRGALGELLSLALPTVAQMVSYTLMQFVDTWQLSWVGYSDAAAAGSSGMWAFSVIGFGVGVLFVVNTLVSQAFGRREDQKCGMYLWQGIWFSVGFSVLLLPVMAGAPKIFQWFGHAPDFAHLEAVYLRIVLLATAVKLMGTALGQFMLGIDRPRVVLLAAIVGVSVNALAGYALTLGHLGWPRLGVVGAAWAQNIGVSVEAMVLMGVCLMPGLRRRFGVGMWRPVKGALGTLLAVGTPSGVQFIADVMAWSVFVSIIIARFGAAALAASIFTFRFMGVSFMPAFGIGSALTALVGRYIGRGEPEVAVRRAHLGFVVTAIYMLGCGAVFWFGRNELMRLFSDDPKVLAEGTMMLKFAAVYQLADALYICYNGALRGAGDTFVPAVATAVLNWGISVGLGWLTAVYWPELGAAGPWMLATIYGLLLGGVIYWRFWRGSWRRIQLERGRGGDKLAEVGIVPAAGEGVKV